MRNVSSAGEKIELIGLIKIFWAKRWLILGATFLITIVLTVFAFFYPRTYLAQAEVELDGFVNPVRVLVHAEGSLYRDLHETHESDIVVVLMKAREEPNSEYYLGRLNHPQRFRRYLDSESVTEDYSEKDIDFRIWLGPKASYRTPDGLWIRLEKLLVETESETAVRAEEEIGLVGGYLKTELMHTAWRIAAAHLERQYTQIGNKIDAEIIRLLEKKTDLERESVDLDAFAASPEKNLPPEWDASKIQSLKYFLPIQQQERGLQLMLANLERRFDRLRRIKEGLNHIRKHLATGYPRDPEKACALGSTSPDRIKQSGENLRVFALSLASGLGLRKLRTFRSRSLINGLVIAVLLFFLVISFITMSLYLWERERAHFGESNK